MKLTKKAVLDLLWNELDQRNHQARWGTCKRMVFKDGDYVTESGDVRKCRDCKGAVRAFDAALNGITFEVKGSVTAARCGTP